LDEGQQLQHSGQQKGDDQDPSGVEPDGMHSLAGFERTLIPTLPRIIQVLVVSLIHGIAPVGEVLLALRWIEPGWIEPRWAASAARGHHTTTAVTVLSVLSNAFATVWTIDELHF
jgi:hypothetical protein